MPSKKSSKKSSNKSSKKSNKKGGSPREHKEHVSEPWYTLISMGLKTVEGRKNKGKFKDMKVGDIIEWHNNDFKARSVKVRITKKKVYPTFAEYLTKEGLQNCLPGIPSLEHGLSVYFKYYTTADEQEYGVMAIRMAKI